MTRHAPHDEHYTPDFEDVARAEQEWIRQRRQAAGNVDEHAPLVGLALSGGGIRSATFNLGVLQALAHRKLLSSIDYLSSVSGGGYIASFLGWLRAQAPATPEQRFDSVPLIDGRGTVLDWLRAHGRYLIVGRGLSGWSLAASVAAGTLLNLFVLLPPFLSAIWLASRDWLPLNWPVALHLPGAHPVNAHDGFMLLAVLGLLMLALYLMTVLLFALSTALPPLRRIAAEQYFRRALGQLLAAGLIALGIGILPVVTGIEESAAAYAREGGAREVARHLTWLLPTVTGAISMWRANKASKDSGGLAVVGLSLLLYGGFTALYHLANHTTLVYTTAFSVWLTASLVLAVLCDINAVSMHSYYRSRLADAFLPRVAANQAHADESRDPALFRLTSIDPRSGTPFPIINTTLNTTSSTNPKLRSRNGENMVLTPLYCGCPATGYRRTSNYLHGAMTLSTAFAISGAAVDPDMYATRARPISFLMTLLNVRLGYWTTNPRRIPHRWRWPAWYQLMLREMLGVGLSETEAKIHLADGGHFENLGLYELLRRRCRYIIVSDAGADPQCTLADLGQAIQRARADLGASIDICADRLFEQRDQGLRDQAYLLGRVTYMDGSTGEILYLKALLRRDLSADIFGYWRLNPSFPDQPTSNQFYGEMQFDSYRELGRQLMAGIIGDATTLEALFRRPADAGLPFNVLATFERRREVASPGGVEPPLPP